MKNILFYLILISPSLIYVHDCFAAQTKFSNGSAILKTKLSTNEMLDIHISTSALSPSLPFASSFRWGGDEIFHPKVFVSSFNVNVASSSVPISLSAYIDLGDPSEISFTETHEGFELSVTGGDAAVGYKCVFSFERSNGHIFLHRRKVVLLEFPDQAWEETQYSDNVETN